MTKIEWADAVWNPVTGCTKISGGCTNCYAKRQAERFPVTHGLDPQIPFERVVLHPERLDQPLHWRKPRRVFVCSMGDLFHEDVPESFIYDVLNVIVAAERHTFMVLTKRPERMLPIMAGRILPMPSNLWLGVSDEGDRHERIEALRSTPAALRFVSFEPVLSDPGTVNLEGIGWAIVGGESGPGARPMHPAWARSLRDQCVVAGVPFFFKQWGEWAHRENWTALPALNQRRLAYGWPTIHGDYYRVGKKAAGRLLDGREWNEFPTNRA